MSSESTNDVAPRGPFLRPKAAAQYLGIASSTLWVLVSRGVLPRPIKLSRGVSLFPQPELDTALERRVSRLRLPD
jgi:predicted DNA-binding transcriptional regulator AlpA